MTGSGSLVFAIWHYFLLEFISFFNFCDYIKYVYSMYIYSQLEENILLGFLLTTFYLGFTG